MEETYREDGRLCINELGIIDPNVNEISTCQKEKDQPNTCDLSNGSAQQNSDCNMASMIPALRP
jgi:hypothetical protein